MYHMMYMIYSSISISNTIDWIKNPLLPEIYLSNTSRSLNSLLWSFIGSNEHVSALHPMQIVSMARLTWLCDELAGWKRVISGKAAADFQWWNLAAWNEEKETTVCYLLLLLKRLWSWESKQYLTSSWMLRSKKESFVPKMDVCIVTCDFECPKITIHKRVRINRYTFNTPSRSGASLGMEFQIPNL